MMEPSGFDQNTILKEIHTKWAGKTVHFAKETDSTNLWAKKLAEEGASHGTLAVAEFQTAGRGRFERRWTAKEGSSIMMSLILRPEFSPQYASMLTLVMGLSVAQAVRETGVEVSIKWPNDVVVSRKKICGILTEMKLSGKEIQHVVIGVGINVAQEEMPEEVRDKATSLFMETGRRLDRNLLLAEILEKFEGNYELFQKTRDLQELKEAYNEILANREQPVRVLNGAASFEGIALGIDRSGVLLVKRETGEVIKVSAGEVSVRGLYSYV